MGDKAKVSTFLTNYINKNEQPSLKNWYVGIASDVKDRLFSDHNVTKDGGLWAHSPADTAAIARAVEAELLAEGLDGGKGGGDDTTKSVYVYVKTSSTDP
ncbi:MAG: hypothetical protein IH910_07415 [Proteobacteria bacterium]|nr:hypothetical protein [Pseudomonadota bacterium]